MKKATQSNTRAASTTTRNKVIKIKPTPPPIPTMMTVRQVAATGILPEQAIRTLLKQNKIPAIYVGTKALINFNVLCQQLNAPA